MGLSPELKALLDTAQEQRAEQMAKLKASGKSLAEIAELYGLTRQRVGQILKQREAAA